MPRCQEPFYNLKCAMHHKVVYASGLWISIAAAPVFRTKMTSLPTTRAYNSSTGPNSGPSWPSFTNMSTYFNMYIRKLFAFQYFVMAASPPNNTHCNSSAIIFSFFVMPSRRYSIKNPSYFDHSVTPSIRGIESIPMVHIKFYPSPVKYSAYTPILTNDSMSTPTLHLTLYLSQRSFAGQLYGRRSLYAMVVQR